MSTILPATPVTARNLAGVAPAMMAAMRGESSAIPLPPARSAILVVVDGLGAIQLRAHRGHARRLAQAMAKRDVAQTVFPSTTAAALSSALTGAMPGEHGLVGYSVLDPDRDIVCNQLNGYEKQGLDPGTWQRSRTVFDAWAEQGGASYAVGRAEYATTGLTRAIMRGAEYMPEDDQAQRVRLAIALAERTPGALVYCYLPELDQAGHRHGVDSDEWRAALEGIDLALAPLADLSPAAGAIVTGDHGMVDVPRHRHVLLSDGDPRLDGVRHLGGEPRLVHVYVEPGVDPSELAAAWRRESGKAADVSTREEAIASGLFGPVVAEPVRRRIGDVLVAARGAWAFYDDRLADKSAQKMVGQHGSVTPEETTVPLIRFGAFRA